MQPQSIYIFFPSLPNFFLLPPPLSGNGDGRGDNQLCKTSLSKKLVYSNITITTQIEVQINSHAAPTFLASLMICGTGLKAYT